MKVSYKWLNEFLDHKLPKTDVAVEALTMHALEVDGVEKVKEDFVFDVKVTPNLAHSCLSHRGIAREFSAILDLPIKSISREFKDFSKVKKSNLDLRIKIQDGDDCRRYVGRIIENIKIGPSPEWLKNRLETLGQRSINNLVDATNFVLFEIGQPMHVFDADKITGNLIEIKKAKKSDEMKTLDGKTLELDENILIISNNEKALAIAGVKGGTVAEIDEKTKNIVLESANFDPVLIRKTAQKIKIQTDASKRYENDLTPELALEAMEIITKLILEIASDENTKVGDIVDQYPSPQTKVNLKISSSEVEKILGLKIEEKDIADIFRRFGFNFKKDSNIFEVEIPAERLDLRIKEDLVEEIGRIYGYEKLKDTKNLSSGVFGKINKHFYYANKLKKFLVEQGFSEIYGYAFARKGDIELANSVAPEKRFLRNNLIDNTRDYLEFNARYSDLIDMPQISVFEIGKVFKIGDEHNSFILGVKNPTGLKKPKEKEVLDSVILSIEKEFNIKLDKINTEDNLAEFNFDNIISKLPEPKSYDVDMPLVDKDMRFKKISIYPFMTRDIAVFTPESVSAEEVLNIIKKEAGALLVKYKLFDEFKKDGKISYAYRLVFQSYEKTLSDDEVGKIMQQVTTKLNQQNGWLVR